MKSVEPLSAGLKLLKAKVVELYRDLFTKDETLIADSFKYIYKVCLQNKTR